MEPKRQLLTGDVARILDVSPDYVRQLERAGVLVAAKTETGVRLFTPDNVQQVARDRAARRNARGRR
jgi:DNA-binding transcriptional MerR regulator